MAYPTVSAPYGFVPVNLLGGQSYAGALRQYPIATAEGTAIYFGDIVLLNAAGGVSKHTATDACTLAVGVFQGCTYTQAATGQKIFTNVLPALTAASDIMAYVADDPDQAFKVAVCAAGGVTISYLAQTDRGQNLCLAAVVAGSTVNGVSRSAVSATSHTTTTVPFKLVEFVSETMSSATNYAEVIVQWNQNVHYARSSAVV